MNPISDSGEYCEGNLRDHQCGEENYSSGNTMATHLLDRPYNLTRC